MVMFVWSLSVFGILLVGVLLGVTVWGYVSSSRMDRVDKADRLLLLANVSRGRTQNLDHVVFDAVHRIAKKVNREGVDAQITYLLKQGMSYKEIGQNISLERLGEAVGANRFVER